MTLTDQPMSDPDTRGPAVAVVGSVSAGFTFYGPFENIDAALKWYENSLNGKLHVNVTIALLTPPGGQT